ncbi:MAG: hypothetical protein IJK41_05660 [Muribaculaceae bacterium]|nr:hypothetical protein [Muribaculaceae bacterium]
MRKTILTLVMMLTMALAAAAAPGVTANAAGKGKVQFKGDSIVVTDGDKSVTVSGVDLKKVQDRINDALDDTLTASDGTTVEIDGYKGELSPEDIKEISNDWASVARASMFYSVWGVVAIVLLVLLFRYLSRRNKYRVIEKAIINNYPLNELSLNDSKRSAIYVQQPIVTSAPGQVPVGTPISGQTPDNPIVMTDMVNWRALMPAIKWMGWGVLLILFSVAIGEFDNPFWPVGLALVFVGACKGYILYKEQKALQEAWKRAGQMAPKSQPMREGIPVPPPMDNDYKEDDNTPYQPY